MRTSAVIPTKNRHEDIQFAIESIFSQSMLPDELIVVDQSEDDKTKHVVESYQYPDISLVYIHETKISGLVEAKKVSVNNSSGDVVLFLEDDVVLYESYIENMVDAFLEHPEILGMSGIMMKGANANRAYEMFFNVFHRGIFFDPRVGVHGRPGVKGDLINSNYLSGGISAFRKEVFTKIPFDTVNGFHMLEDIDFSTRAVRHFGKERFYINTASLLDHNFSPVGRANQRNRYHRKMIEYLTFYKKHRQLGEGGMVSLAWLMAGLLLEGIFTAIRIHSPSPLIGLYTGTIRGVNKKVIDLKLQT